MKDTSLTLYTCHAARDGDCAWSLCPQNRDNEPSRSSRHCPLDRTDDADNPIAQPMPPAGLMGSHRQIVEMSEPITKFEKKIHRVQIDFTESAYAKLLALKERAGLPSVSETVRSALGLLDSEVPTKHVHNSDDCDNQDCGTCVYGKP